MKNETDSRPGMAECLKKDCSDVFPVDIYGTYILDTKDYSRGQIGRKYSYTSTFANGNYSIWWCGTKWQIGMTSIKEQSSICWAIAHSSEIEQCVHWLKHSWTYFKGPSLGDYYDAGRSIQVSCKNEAKVGSSRKFNLDNSDGE